MVAVTELLEKLLTVLQMASGWELTAVTLSLLYLVLVVFERIECWYAAFVSTIIFLFLFWDVDLLMESALQLYYLAIAVYGWWQWNHPNVGKTSEPSEQRVIQTWPLILHLKVLVSLMVMVLVSGYLLSNNTQAALPYLDSFTTWGSVVTTYMVTRKVLENWLYWIVIDSVSIYLYLDRGLYPTVALFCVYVVVACFGYLQWLHRCRLQSAPCLTSS
jgi:nicotinamide mononucleotide transporter